MRFADRDQSDFVRASIRFPRRRRDLSFYFREPFRQTFRHRFYDKKIRAGKKTEAAFKRLRRSPRFKECAAACQFRREIVLSKFRAADVAELVDAQVSEACSRKGVEVRFFSSALIYFFAADKQKKGCRARQPFFVFVTASFRQFKSRNEARIAERAARFAKS
jgi:hypothetical protein